VTYVAEHFGSAESPKADWPKLSAYWNLDHGTGRIRAASIFGPAASGPILAQLLKPWEEFGVVGAKATVRGGGSTDVGSFYLAGLPGIDTLQDPIEYDLTHHSNLDTYERLVPEDLMKAAVVTASAVYHIANRTEMMPRLTATEMPASDKARVEAIFARRRAESVMAVDHLYAAEKNRVLSVAAPGLLDNDARARERTPPTSVATMADPPVHGKLVVRLDGAFTYAPVQGFTGLDTFTYNVASGSATSTGKVLVTVK
jgi:Bacterial Ig domain